MEQQNRMVGTEITMVMGALDDSKDDLQISIP
jgi:hypothetical protein